MAYEHTIVSVDKSHHAIRKLLSAHGAINIAFASNSEPPQEGLMATVTIGDRAYAVRIAVPVKPKRDQEQETRRVWRVLYHHLKAIFEAADSGVIDIRELLLPFFVTKQGKTFGQLAIENLDIAVDKPRNLLLIGQ